MRTVDFFQILTYFGYTWLLLVPRQRPAKIPVHHKAANSLDEGQPRAPT